MKKRLDHINIMDTEYNIEYRTEEEDPSLEACLGYCDKYQKLIVIDDSESGNLLKHYTLDSLKNVTVTQ